MRKREIHINIRVTPAEKAAFERNARKCGLSLSEYLRKLASGYEPKALPPLDYRKIYDLLLDVYFDWRSESDPRLANYLLDIIRQMMTDIDSAAKGGLSGPPQSLLCGEKEQPRSGEPFAACGKSDERRVL